MKQLFWTLLASVILVTCGDDASNNTQQNTTPPQVSDSEKISLLTHRYLVQDQQILNTFQLRANKQLNVYQYSGEQAVALAEAGKLHGDLIIVEDLYQAHRLKQANAIEPYNAGTFGEFIPNRYVDNEGFWAGLSRWTMSLAYRPGAVDVSDMLKYGAIIAPKYKGRIAMAHPDSSGLVTMIAGMIAAHGEEPARIYLQSLKNNLHAPPKGSDWDAISAVLRGNADVALVNGAEFMRYKHSGNPELFQSLDQLGLEIPVDADGNNYYNITPICMVKDATYRNYARTLVEFLTVQEFQDIFPEAGFEYPVNVFSEIPQLLNSPFNLPQGKITMEQTENQLDKAAALVNEIF